MSLRRSPYPQAPLALLTLVAWASVIHAPRSARAQAQRDPVAAEALFDQARGLMESGRYEDACPKLEASQSLDPGVGTLLNLGDCLEKMGRTASAWERFREAAAAAVQSGQTEREEVARGRAAALLPRLCRLAVQVAPDATLPGLALERDGVAFDRPLWNEALPVDPGSHDVRARAPGKRPWSSAVGVDGATCAGTTRAVDLPPLEDTKPPPPPIRAPRAPRTTRWGIERQLALVGGGVGLALLGAGIGLAEDASSTYAGAKGQCGPLGCPPSAQRSAGSAGQVADFATAAFVAAGAVLAGSGVLWLFAKERPVRIDLALGATGAGLGVRGDLP